MKTSSIILLILAIAVILTLLVVLPIILAILGKLDKETLFALAGLVISWPTATLLLGLLFMTRFHTSIDTFLGNIAHMRFPGGFELQSQSQPLTKAEPIAGESPVSLSQEDKEQVGDLRQRIGELEQLSQAEKDVLSQSYEAALSAASWWKFSYLNLFLVQQTKQVLFWFSQTPPQSPQTRATFLTLWAPFIRDVQQRTIMLEVLLQNGLLEEEKGIIRITPEGYAFLQFTGAIPYPPPLPQQLGA